MGGVFMLLLVGLYFASGGGKLPVVEQVSSPEASTLQMTSNEGALLALLIFAVVSMIIGMGVGTYAIFWFLNREITRVQQQPNQQFELLSMGTEGNTTGALLANNALIIVGLVGVAMVVATVLVLFVMN
jgi:hypothetical protein